MPVIPTRDGQERENSYSNDGEDAHVLDAQVLPPVPMHAPSSSSSSSQYTILSMQQQSVPQPILTFQPTSQPTITVQSSTNQGKVNRHMVPMVHGEDEDEEDSHLSYEDAFSLVADVLNEPEPLEELSSSASFPSSSSTCFPSGSFSNSNEPIPSSSSSSSSFNHSIILVQENQMVMHNDMVNQEEKEEPNSSHDIGQNIGQNVDENQGRNEGGNMGENVEQHVEGGQKKEAKGVKKPAHLTG